MGTDLFKDEKMNYIKGVAQAAYAAKNEWTTWEQTCLRMKK